MINIVKKIRQKFCKHEKICVTIDLHGDGTAEEVRICTKCGKREVRKFE